MSGLNDGFVDGPRRVIRSPGGFVGAAPSGRVGRSDGFVSGRPVGGFVGASGQVVRADGGLVPGESGRSSGAFVPGPGRVPRSTGGFVPGLDCVPRSTGGVVSGAGGASGHPVRPDNPLAPNESGRVPRSSGVGPGRVPRSTGGVVSGRGSRGGALR